MFQVPISYLADGLPLILKTPQPPVGPREAERYRREFGILRRLRDVPGVTHVHAREPDPDRPLLLLEEVEGEPLSDLTGQPLEVTRVLDLGICLASTLAELKLLAKVAEERYQSAEGLA